MEEIDIIIYPKKRKKDQKDIKNVIVKVKSLDLSINIFYGFDSTCYDLIMRY